MTTVNSKREDIKFYCEGCAELFHKSEMVNVDGYYWCRNCDPMREAIHFFPGDPDTHADQALDLAAESGWGPCAECGKWQPRDRMMEHESYLYCPEHTPDLHPAILEWLDGADPQELAERYAGVDAQREAARIELTHPADITGGGK